MPIAVNAAGAHRNHTTLDIPERQLLIGMQAAPQPYMHHILFIRLDVGRLVTADPDLDVAADSLHGEELIPLGRNAAFRTVPPDVDICVSVERWPSGLLAEGRPFYTFDHITEAELARLRARAAEVAAVLGTAVPPIPGLPVGAVWVFSDPAHTLFSTEVPEGLIGDPLTLQVQGAVGLVAHDDGLAGAKWTHMERVARGDLASWLVEKREGIGRDKRLSNVHAPSDGSRILFGHSEAQVMKQHRCSKEEVEAEEKARKAKRGGKRGKKGGKATGEGSEEQ